MCCVCNLLCKLISFAISVLTLVLLVLMILWLTGVLFNNDNGASNTGSVLGSAGEYKYSSIGASLT